MTTSKIVTTITCDRCGQELPRVGNTTYLTMKKGAVYHYRDQLDYPHSWRATKRRDFCNADCRLIFIKKGKKS